MKLPIDVAISRFDYRKTQTCEIENRKHKKNDIDMAMKNTNLLNL